MKKHIRKKITSLRQRPLEERKKIANFAAAALTLFIVILWIILLVFLGGKKETKKEESSSGFKALFQDLGEQFSDIKEKTSEIKNYQCAGVSEDKNDESSQMESSQGGSECNSEKVQELKENI